MKAWKWVLSIVIMLVVGGGLNWVLALLGLSKTIVQVIDLVLGGVWLWMTKNFAEGEE